ncbi:MAG: DNA polymerase III subunit gamma/tau [Ilumatobacteraceae bacterium]
MATQSLYRRYRPRRFGELRGQDHVVRALRDAVASGREGQAYLFSGPRGTGKTTSARILAKVLNCERVVEGEPCCECDSCLAVERGTSYDVHELDAASNRGIDAIRDLVEKASLGTAGRHKVYILDEVHMLTKEASAALLKTLEEPPPHVVFVLATTDPQKVLDTIRSRTQHLQFHLLPSDVLADHVKWVADDAGLQLPQAALDAALVRGGGSARDTLSALELLATTGGEVGESVDPDEFLVAMTEHDPGRALTALARAVGLGHDPRTVAEDVVRHLRNAFMTLMAPDLVMLPVERREALADRARELGAAALVRGIERLGSVLVDMRHAPDPRIMIEVALVQLTHEAVGTDTESLAARLERLEDRVRRLGDSGGTAAGAATTAGRARSVPTDPTTGRAILGGAARSVTPPEPTDPTGTEQTGTEPAREPMVAAPEPTAAAPEPAAPSPTAVPAAWDGTVKAQLKPIVRALFSVGQFVGQDPDGTWRFSVPNAAHADKCREHRAAVESALSTATGAAVGIEFVVAGGGDSTPAPTAVPESTADEDIDLGELTDAPPESVKSPIDRLAEAFPGSELLGGE